MVDTATGEALEFDCKSWRCPVHGPRLRYRWMQRLAGVPWNLMITFTKVSGSKEEARKQWAYCSRWLRKEGMHTFLRVTEYGEENGMKHWHVLEGGIKHVDVERLRGVVAEAGLGERVHAANVYERRGAAFYLLKYATKNLGDYSGERDRSRRLTCSRNIAPYRVIRDAKIANDPTKEVKVDGSWKVVR